MAREDEKAGSHQNRASDLQAKGLAKDLTTRNEHISTIDSQVTQTITVVIMDYQGGYLR